MRIDRGLGARTLKENVCNVVQSKNVNGGSVKVERNFVASTNRSASLAKCQGRPCLMVKRNTIWAREKYNRERCIDSKLVAVVWFLCFPVI